MCGYQCVGWSTLLFDLGGELELFKGRDMRQQ